LPSRADHGGRARAPPRAQHRPEFRGLCRAQQACRSRAGERSEDADLATVTRAQNAAPDDLRPRGPRQGRRTSAAPERDLPAGRRPCRERLQASRAVGCRGRVRPSCRSVPEGLSARMTNKTIASGTVADAYLALLADRGIDYLFANAGTDFAPIIEAYAKA